MVFSRFIWVIVLNILMIVVTAVGLGYFLQRPGYPFTVSILVTLLVSEAVYLFVHLVRIRRDILKLVNSLRYQDTTTQFSKDAGDPYFSEIHRGFNDIIRNFRLVRLDKEAEHHFFRSTIDHIQFGIIAFDEEGKVEMTNRAFRELFQSGDIISIDAPGGLPASIPGILRSMHDQQEVLKKVHLNNRHHHLIFLASEFLLSGKRITLVSVRDISKEIDKNELEAWQKLIRILKHEILNSISPIKLLSGNMVTRINREGKEPALDHLSREEIADLLTGLETINRRAKGLSDFVEAYSHLYQIPKPDLRDVEITDLLERSVNLFQEQLKSEHIKLTLQTGEEKCHAVLDERLIEQVLINLVKNAIEATAHEEKREVKLSLNCTGDRLIISVWDNGIGITPDQLESIFIPFYSTKEEGNGIGLSFSQHVMRLHNGYITVTSTPGEGSEVSMVFNPTF